MSSEKERMKKLLSEMECPICMEYMTADIYQCHNSHNVCGICNSKITKCPCCSLPVTMRNRGLEKMARELSYPCKYPGCEEAYSMDELEVHLSECPFGSFKCPMTCCFKAVLEELLVHLVIKHENVLSNPLPGKPLINTLLDVRPKSCWDQLVASAGSFFFCSFVYSKNTFYGYVKHVGPPTSHTYIYEMSLIGADEKAAFTMKNEVHPFADLEDDIFKTKSCLMIEKDMLQRYLDKRRRLKTLIMLYSVVKQQADDIEKYNRLGAIPKVAPKVKPKKPITSGSRKFRPK